MEFTAVRNNQSIPLAQIPLLDYERFYDLNTGWVVDNAQCHCVNYYGYRVGDGVMLICAIANDADGQIYLSKCKVLPSQTLNSFTQKHHCFERFEREIHENFGIGFNGHPWLKPVRYAHNRADLSQTMANYPFYSIDSEELHEVGVGPIHAGIIEPGHFRFICNGEQILHLEIQLGYQHRGIEALMVQATALDKRAIVAESIAGDTVVGHTVTFSQLWESLCGVEVGADVAYARTLALELERMAIHTGDLSAICGDMAYQLGSAVLGRLRTPLVNFMQEWGGCRLSKGLVRPFTNRFPFTHYLAGRLHDIFNNAYERDFVEITDQLFTLPSALSRLERTGVILPETAAEMGFVGMGARASGLLRDVRLTHPTGLYSQITHEPVVLTSGDVHARTDLRRKEVLLSMGYLRNWIGDIPEPSSPPTAEPKAQPNRFAISLTEGWRGEICHCAITGDDGQLVHYKVKDPSFHNWMALALAVRNNEISDFPLCNKSFNLSYVGHDL
jgi:Ni,Fe-hydrogenase III large subunit